MNAGPREQRLVLLIAEYDYFLSHRLALARAAVDAGYSPCVITRIPPGSTPVSVAGVSFIHYPIRRSLKNPLVDLRLLWFLVRTFRRLQPRIVHNVSVKLAVLGAIAARLTGVPGIVNAYTGLGYAFRSPGFASSFIRLAVCPVLAGISRGRGCWSIFQNEADRDELRGRGVTVDDRTALIRGSGVDLQEFAPAPEPEGEVVVLFAGRLLWDKGIGEFVQAAESLRHARVRARFVAVGEPDPENPRNVDAQTLSRWRATSCVEWWGTRRDMPQVYAQAHIVCLPSYHEGLPKVLLEAAASARAVVATDIPGCADVVRNGESGFLVPAADAVSLAKAIEKLIVNKELRDKMGSRGRHIAEQRFAVSLINGQILDVYKTLLGAGQD